MIRTIVCGCTVFVVSGVAAAQGSFNFDDIPGIDQEPFISVDINPVVMRFIETTIRGTDPAGADMLTGLRSLKLRVYQMGDAENERLNAENTRQINGFIDNVTQELEDSGWEGVVRTQDEGAKVRMFMRMTEDEISGMTVMASDGAEAIFINIDGTISAENLARVMSMLPVEDVLGSFPLPPAAPPTDSRPTPE